MERAFETAKVQNVDWINQGITSKYLPATNHKSARVTAWNQSGAVRVTLPYDHALNAEQNHAKAAEAVAAKLGWTGKIYQGSVDRKATGFVFVVVKG